MDNVEAPPAPALSTSSSFFTPLLISMVGIVCTSLVIVTYHLILTRYCRRRRQAAAAMEAEAIRSGTFFNSRFLYGVDDKVLETIPIIPYSAQNHDFFRLDQSECAVCIGELEDGEMVRVLPNCKHAFHVPCIDQWFLRHANCPVCRSPVVASTNREREIPSPASCSVDESNIRIVVSSHHDHDHRDQTDTSTDHHNASPMTNNVKPKPCGLLRHCVSLVLPREKKPRLAVTGLKRSLSMDQTGIIIERDHSSNSSLKSGTHDLTRSKSAKQFDHRVSIKLWKSFSRFSMGARHTNGIILPY